MTKHIEKVVAATQATAPAGWEKVQTERPCWKPEAATPIQGLLIGLLDMPPTAQGKPWQAFVVRLTAPTTVYDRKGELTRINSGEVLIPATAQLSQVLARPAAHPSLAFEIHVSPIAKVAARVGSMWTYEVHVNPRPIQRSGGMRLMAQAAAPALPPARAEEVQDDLPF
jgi:hypothetical protein